MGAHKKYNTPAEKLAAHRIASRKHREKKFSEQLNQFVNNLNVESTSQTPIYDLAMHNSSEQLSPLQSQIPLRSPISAHLYLQQPLQNSSVHNSSIQNAHIQPRVSVSNAHKFNIPEGSVTIELKDMKKPGAPNKNEVSVSAKTRFATAMKIIEKLYEKNNRSFDNDFRSYMKYSAKGNTILRSFGKDVKELKGNSDFQLYGQDKLKISDNSWRALRTFGNIKQQLFSDKTLQLKRSNLNNTVADKIGLIDSKYTTQANFSKYFTFLFEGNECTENHVYIKLSMDNGKDKTKVMFQPFYSNFLKGVHILGVSSEKKESSESLKKLQDCFDSIAKVVKEKKIIINNKEIELTFINVTDLAGLWAMHACKCPYCNYDGSDINQTEFQPINFIDLFGTSNFQYCICLMHCYMRTTEHLICDTCKKYPQLETEISKLPGMSWFKLITKETKYDSEILFSKCPLLSKHNCTTVLLNSKKLLHSINASNQIIDLWVKNLKLVENLFLASSEHINENATSVENQATEYCVAYRNVFSRTFVYLHILEHHIAYLISKFDLPTLQNQEVEHEHSIFDKVATRKTNWGGGARSKQNRPIFSQNGQAVLYNARQLYLNYKLKASKQLTRFEAVLTSRKLTKQNSHANDVSEKLGRIKQTWMELQKELDELKSSNQQQAEHNNEQLSQSQHSQPVNKRTKITSTGQEKNLHNKRPYNSASTKPSKKRHIPA